MNSKVNQIFEQAIELNASDREQFLRDACNGDDSLLAEVQSLLAAHDSAGDFLAAPTAALAANVIAQTHDSAELTEEPGQVIDRYKLLENIGEGGFGTVYMAQQSEPIRRRVALKIIKLGMDTKQIVARFEAERQALALMDHPNIARVIDGGATKTGRPYFVMELVRGDPITQYCDREKLTTRQRLELFQQVCLAVQHAHQKGIIHRDIKPSNVLVTISDDKPQVKVIDFGIAKATNSELTEKTLFTEFRQLIGTPQYMSPEQFERSGVDVDTRTDIYSLGVLLYEILTGSTPVDPKKLGSAAWQELQRVICEEEPTKPSALVSSANVDSSDLAKRRSTEPARLGGLLRGDLDWIVLKSLEKERSRRYASASQFAEDIDRYLRDEAVDATPPGRIYRLRKFARRNKTLLAATAAVLLALSAGLIATSITASFAIRAKNETQKALSETEQANRVAEAAAMKAKRSAIIAGAGLLLPDEEVEQLVADWQHDLQQQPLDADETIEKQHVQEATQFATWYSGWLLQKGRNADAVKLADEYFEQAKQVLGHSDASFFALCNVSAQAHFRNDSPPAETATIYTELMKSMEAVRGEQGASELLPEYAAVLVKADLDEQAATAIRTYLSRRSASQTSPSGLDNIRLDMALNGLVKWGEHYPEVYQQLKRYRETGTAHAAAVADEDDTELAEDAKAIQGVWHWKRREKGVVVEHMITEFSENATNTRWVDKDGKTLDGHTGYFKLSRNGSAKIFTSYVSNSSQGVSFIFRMDKDRFILVSGMLTNQNSLPEVKMRVWNQGDGIGK